MTNLSAIEGMGPVLVERLHAVGIDSCEALLKLAGTSGARAAIGRDARLSIDLIYKFVCHADLLRIHGLSGAHAELLEACGIRTIDDLAMRDAEELAMNMSLINAGRTLTRPLPGSQQVARWIAQAELLDSMITP